MIATSRTIFTSRPELVSHQAASNGDSDIPDSITKVGQSVTFSLESGLNAESASFELVLSVNLVLPTEKNIKSG